MNHEIHKLHEPPISEVVCAFVFEKTELGVLDFGVYADEMHETYPKRELRPVLEDNVIFQMGATEQRVWLITEDNTIMLQLQHDRFIVNWRRHPGAAYPRFSRHGGVEGLRDRAIAAFEHFRTWAEARQGQSLRLQRLELVKVDVLLPGIHYPSLETLHEVLRMPRFSGVIQTETPEFMQVRLVEGRNTLPRTRIDINVQQHAQIQTQYLFEPEDDLGAAFDNANNKVNRVFFGLIDTDRMEEVSRGNG